MFPSDAISTWNEVAGIGNTVVVSGNSPKTILGFAIQQGNTASLTDVRCGTTPVGRNYATNLPYIPINKLCNDTINIEKTGNDNASVVITYVNYNLTKKSTTTPLEIYNMATSSNNFGLNGNEWLFIVGVFLFFVSFNSWGKIHMFKKNKV